MARTQAGMQTSARRDSLALPEVRKITAGDLRQVLAKGVDDFLAKPSHIILLVLIYPLVGLVLARLTFGYEVLPILFPLTVGFALIGPFAAVGLYEISRRREQGLPISWRHAFDVINQDAIWAIIMLGIVLLAIFIGWLFVAQWIYFITFGEAVPASFFAFVGEVLTTPHGWWLIVLGNGAGFCFAVLVLAISVISFPFILDRNVSAALAVQTSIRACMANPLPMALWGMAVAVLLALGSVPFFTGLAIVLPVLGHATWHLYRKVVSP